MNAYFFELARYEQAIRPQPDPFIDEFVGEISELINRYAARSLEMGLEGTQKLKPCPFCGESMARLVIVGGWYSVVCGKCQAQANPFCMSEIEAAATWNYRAETVRLEETLAAVGADLNDAMRMIP